MLMCTGCTELVINFYRYIQHNIVRMRTVVIGANIPDSIFTPDRPDRCT